MKKNEKKTGEELIQPNQITMARYDYTLWEKRVMFQIIRSIQGEIRGDNELPRSTMGDIYFQMPYRSIDPDLKNRHLVTQALQNLRAKNINIEYDNRFWIGGLINWAEKEEDDIITVSLPQRIMPFLTEIALGFTAFSATVAMTLKSIYSQRLYETCSRFKDMKRFSMSPKEMKERFMLPDSYKDYSLLRTRVLDRAQKELKELFDKNASDLYFTFEEVRTGRGRGGQVKQIIFRIYTSDNFLTQGLMAESAATLETIASFLIEYFKDDHPDNRAYTNALFVELDRKALERIDHEQLKKIIEIAKTKKSPAAYFRATMKNNYDLPSNVKKLKPKK